MEQSARRAAGFALRVYNTGSAVVRGAALSDMKSHSAKVKVDVPAFLLKHPKHGHILFDTGLDPAADKNAAKYCLAHFLSPFAARPGEDVLSRLAAEKMAASEIKWVVISHMHPDHAGLIHAFPEATVLVDEREHRAQNAPREIAHKLRLVDLSSAPAFGAFDHAQDLFEDGSVFLVDLAGHTPGTMGLWANLGDGPVLLAGDASWVLDNHQDLAMPAKSQLHDAAQYRRRLHAMRAMQEEVPQLVIFPGHDLTPLRLQPRADITLAPTAR